MRRTGVGRADAEWRSCGWLEYVSRKDTVQTMLRFVHHSMAQLHFGTLAAGERREQTGGVLLCLEYLDLRGDECAVAVGERQWHRLDRPAGSRELYGSA